MHSRFRRTGALACVGAVLFGALAVRTGTQAGAQSIPLDDILDQATPGKVALAEVQPRLAELAQLNGVPEQQLLRTLATDETSWLDEGGQLFFQPPANPDRGGAEPAAPRWAKQAVAVAEGPAFELHSKPGSNRVIYLDFDGHVITGTAWNTNGRPETVNVTPYDTDGIPDNFSAAEQDAVRAVWQRVAEDYAPFDVDVTTQQPPQSAITRTDAGDYRYGTRVLIDPTGWYHSGCNCGGASYLGVYDRTGDHDYYQPALVFTRGTGTGAKDIAEVASYAAGQNLGLSPDGTSTTSHYQGHGAWAPIMGVSYDKAISQWSIGEYADANNTENDYAVIGRHGVALRADDHGNERASATALTLGATTEGVYATGSDVDVFRIDLPDGTFTFAADAAPVGGNLDIRLELLSSSGAVIATADPASGQADPGTPTGLSASIRQEVAAGRYYLRVDTTGYGDPRYTGYSTYGSRGAYSVGVTTD